MRFVVSLVKTNKSHRCSNFVFRVHQQKLWLHDIMCKLVRQRVVIALLDLLLITVAGVRFSISP